LVGGDEKDFARHGHLAVELTKFRPMVRAPSRPFGLRQACDAIYVALQYDLAYMRRSRIVSVGKLSY